MARACAESGTASPPVGECRLKSARRRAALSRFQALRLEFHFAGQGVIQMAAGRIGKRLGGRRRPSRGELQLHAAGRLPVSSPGLQR